MRRRLKGLKVAKWVTAFVELLLCDIELTDIRREFHGVSGSQGGP
jgi:hypothetical protein